VQAVTSILFACEYYPPFAPGGAEWSTATWAAALARRGHRVTVVTPNYGAAPREERDGVTIVRVPFPVKLQRKEGSVGWLVHRNVGFHLYFAWQIRRVARAAGAQVIHAQGKAALFGAWLAGASLRRPVLVTIRDLGLMCPYAHCTQFEENWRELNCPAWSQYQGKCVPYHLKNYRPGISGWQRTRVWIAATLSFFDQKMLQFALSRVNGAIGVSRAALGVFGHHRLPHQQEVVHNLPPQVDVPSASEADNVRRRLGIGSGPLVLYAGKLSIGKGTHVFLDSLPSIRSLVPEVRFALAGKGDMLIPTAADIYRLGQIEQADLFALYATAAVVVVPSVWEEPFSRVLLEAMRMGRPVVATRVGGTPEAVEDGVTGLLVPKRNSDALAKAIVELLLDASKRERMGEAARRRATQFFDEGKLVDQLLDVYRKACAA
jgi:glycosyltransferase involved in cell wall biosynthesis